MRGFHRGRLAKGVYGDAAGAIAVSFGGQLALVVSGVVVARLLGVGDRGRLALLVLLATTITQLGSLGMPLAVTYWIAREPTSASRVVHGLRRFVRRQVLALVVIQAVVLGLALRHTGSAERLAALISLLVTPALLGWQYGLAVLQGQRRFFPWNLSRLVFPAGYAAGVVALYVSGVDSLPIVVTVWVGLMWLTAAVTLLAASRGLDGAVADGGSPSDQPDMLRFGLKALLGSVSPLQTFNLDQALVGLMLSPAALGIYVVAVSFTNLPFFIALGVGAVAYPNIAASTDIRHIRRATVGSALVVLVLAAILVAALEFALSSLVPWLFGAAFTPSVGVARIILIYALLVALRRVLGECARGAGYPALSTADEIVALVCLVPGALLLIGHGAKGVAVAMVISAAIGLTVIVVGLIIALGRPGTMRRAQAGPSGFGVDDRLATPARSGEATVDPLTRFRPGELQPIHERRDWS